MAGLFDISCAQPWLVARFATPQRMLSWSIHAPGLVTARSVAWLEVRDADLPIGVDPLGLLRERLDAAGLADAVAMMTSRDIRRHRVAGAVEAGTEAMAAVTLGLTNGVVFAADGSVQPASTPRAIGTINILAAVSRALDDAALLEAVSVVATARSAALLADGGTIAATGTDCIVVAAPLAGAREAYSGLHTAAGRSLAAAAYAATRAARAEWEAEFAPRRRA